MDRIVVIGTSCSGKTTFARRFAEMVDIPWYELDRLHWMPGWNPRPLDEFRRMVAEKASRDRWVIDGNYGKVRDIIWPRATHIIWLNYSFQLTFSRALRRTLKRLWTGERLFSGNQESWRVQFFDRDSILLWVIKTYGPRKRDYPDLFAIRENAHLRVYEFLRPSDAEKFLRRYIPFERRAT